MESDYAIDTGLDHYFFSIQHLEAVKAFDR